MNKILVTYQTHSGTTREVASVIGEELAKTGAAVEVLPVEEVGKLADYDAVVLGAPMIMGWHKDAFKFLRKFKTELAQKPLAVFVTAMSLTNTGRSDPKTVSIHVDEKLAPKLDSSKGLSLKERYAAVENYTRPILKASPASLRAIGLFGGRLDYYRLKWWETAFVMLIIGAKPGEKRNWPDIHAWAASLPDLLK